MKCKKFNQTERTFLSTYRGSVRKFFFMKLIDGNNFNDILPTVSRFNNLRNEFENSWKLRIIKNSKQEILCPEVAEIIRNIEKKKESDTDITITNYNKLLSTAQKLSKDKNNYGAKFLVKELKWLNENLNIFDKVSYDLFCKGASIEEIKAAIEKPILSKQIRQENILYIKQTIKHILFLKEVGISPTLDLLKVALNPQYSDSTDVLDMQAQAVMSTYQAIEDPREAMETKMLCYDFIAQSFKVAKRPDALLIDFCTKGDWISYETFLLFKDAHQIIKEYGMEILVYKPFHELAKKVRKKRQLNDSDRYIVTIEKMYSMSKN